MWQRNNPLHLAQTLPEDKLKSLSIYFDVGTNDRLGLDATNVKLDEILTARGIEHSFHLRDGGHGREFFADNVAHSLEFHGKAFAAAQQAAPKEF
jgi:S-formylglutathione hydrolase FrmB